MAWMMFRLLPAFLVAVCLSGPCFAAEPISPAAAFAKTYFDGYFRLQPAKATNFGIHDYDDKLPDLSAAGQAAWTHWLRLRLAEAEAMPRKDWPVTDSDDFDYLIASMKGEILAVDRVALWRKDPNSYIVAATDAIFGLMKRDFAPEATRLRSVVARELRIPALLAEAKHSLTMPARVYDEIALAQIDDTIAFFKNDVPSAFPAVTDPRLKAGFAKSNAAVIAALEDYKQFLGDLLPKANSPFALGTAVFQEKLADEDMVDLPVAKILEIGMAQLRRDQATVQQAAHQIDPTKSTAEVLARVEADHVAADHLLATASDQLAMLRRFVIDHKIVTVPGEDQPKVEETPPFMRATTFASMDAPSVLEQHATQAFYFITLPDPRWSAEKQEEYMRGYSTPLLQNVSVHEVWPGHFVQHLYEVANPGRSLIRKVLSANTTVEGWAHYTEQMMVDEGLGNGDPAIRLTQGMDALLRDCRLIVGIRLHTMGMSIDEAHRFFIEEGYQEKVVGEMETYRGTEDPTYLYYTLGKLEILKLREDYRAKQGAAFSLLDFHDRFNRAGFLPIKLIRREIMGSDGPLL
jgi:uncharacterized protein (DUF885 family)